MLPLLALFIGSDSNDSPDVLQIFRFGFGLGLVNFIISEGQLVDIMLFSTPVVASTNEFLNLSVPRLGRAYLQPDGNSDSVKQLGFI